MSTDIAEFLGAALGLNLLFHVPLFPAGLITGVIAFGILELQRHGYRRFELAIAGLLGIIFLGFLYETLKIGPSAHASLRATFIPHLAGTQSLYLAVGIIGATVMPHAIYLHSALTQGRMEVRNDTERSRVLRFERLDVIVALGFAGLINMAMLAVAAKLFHTPALSGLSTRSRRRTPSSAISSAARRRSPSRSPCSRRAPRRRASARTRARWSWPASSTSASRSCSAAPSR